MFFDAAAFSCPNKLPGHQNILIFADYTTLLKRKNLEEHMFKESLEVEEAFKEDGWLFKSNKFQLRRQDSEITLLTGPH